MIQLSPQITVPAHVGISEPQNIGLAEQNAVKEKDKDDENTFSKLLAGILKKIKTANADASDAKDSSEAITTEKAAQLSKLKVLQTEDETNENEGIAALFARMDGLKNADYLPRKSEIAFGNEGIAALEKISAEVGELEPKRLGKEFSAESKDESDGTERISSIDSLVDTDSLTQIDTLAKNSDTDISGSDVSLNELSAEGIDAAKSEDKESQKTGFVDALAAETEKSSLVENYHFQSQAKNGLVDENAENQRDGKVKDKRKERIAALENGEGRVEASQKNSSDGTSKSTNEDFSNQQIDADIVVELRDGRSQAEDRGLAREVRNAGNFQDMLSRELHNGLNTEIVRHANIVLRQNGEGLIRLTLHPESLGNIKIKLEMADNKVSGRIIFESDEAMKAFEKEIASLEQSFVDSGFDGASLEMALASDHQNDGAGQQWKGEEARPFFSERFVASSYESAIDIDGMLETARGMNVALVDVLA
jgi:flagellar hook-length control protein FliK